MNKIGLIGGIGPESTISYYRQIVHGVQKVQGEKVLPRLSIETLSAFHVFALCKDGRYDELAKYVLDAINCLAAAGATHAALTGNTPNVVFEQLKARSPIPLVSAVEATLEAAQCRNVKKIALLGTVFTMEGTFFQKPFAQAGIEVVTPDRVEIAYIQDRIETELEHGIVTESTREGLIRIIRAMQEQHGIHQVILGCTELPLILSDDNSPVPCLDTLALHVAKLVKLITT